MYINGFWSSCTAFKVNWSILTIKTIDLQSHFRNLIIKIWKGILTQILELTDKIQNFSNLPITRRGSSKIEIKLQPFSKLKLSSFQYKQILNQNYLNYIINSEGQQKKNLSLSKDLNMR